MDNIINKIYWPAFIILIIYPLYLIGLGAVYVCKSGIGWFEVILFLTGYYVSNISVGIGLHRLWAHDTYKASKILEFALILVSAGTLQGPALAWASDHYNHHTFTDKELDPHSPNKYKNKFLGFFWSHLGWMLIGEPSYKHINRVTLVKLGKNKMLKWQMKYYWQLATFMNTIVPTFVGFIIGGNLASAYAGFLFIGLGRALQQQATFAVNSVCHFLGSRNYYKGTAGDIWWLALFLLGENWHNFHHAFPSDYRNGAKWYHFDVHKWIIYCLSKVGLASNLKVTTETRVQARFNDTQQQIQENQKAQLLLVKNKAQTLLEQLKQNIVHIENSSANMKKNVRASFLEIQESLRYLIEQISSVNLENPSIKLLKLASNNVKKAEKTIYALYSQLGFAKLPM